MQKDALQMLLNGARTDRERERDFLVRHALLEPGQDFGFSLGKTVTHLRVFRHADHIVVRANGIGESARYKPTCLIMELISPAIE